MEEKLRNINLLNKRYLYRERTLNVNIKHTKNPLRPRLSPTLLARCYRTHLTNGYLASHLAGAPTQIVPRRRNVYELGTTSDTRQPVNEILL